MKMKPLRVAIAGLGTVGSSVVSLLQKQDQLIEDRAGRFIQITAVSARSKAKHNTLDLDGIDWVEDAKTLPFRDDVDVVCELIGGAEGIAKELCELTLTQGKSLVTANKALLATHGFELAKRAEENKAAILFEAAIAGGIPIVKAMREGLAGNKISSLSGILNGTSNYILDQMSEGNISFDAALEQAQELGYAEADPSADLDGLDAAHKLALLGTLAYGVQPDLKAVSIEGIRPVTQTDTEIAKSLGFVIKLLAVSRLTEKGLEQCVGPFLVPLNTQLGSTHGVLNHIQVCGDFVGALSLTGAGAGGEATASAISSDLVDLARGTNLAIFGVPTDLLTSLNPLPPEKCVSSRYIRVETDDKAGIFDEIQAVLRAMAISVETAIQTGNNASAVILTNDINDTLASKALNRINQVEGVRDVPLCLRIKKKAGED